MPVSVTWSLTNGGAAISEPLDHGTGVNGDTLAAQEIHLRHDGVNQITNCGFYLAQKSGAYAGDADAPSDLAELLAWGDDSTENGFGGFQVNMDAVGGFGAGAWPLYNSKQPTNGSAFFTGVGDTAANKIQLPTSMNLGTPGNIPAGATPNVRFQARIQVPTDEDTPGVRQFDQKLRFTFTS